MNIFLNRDGSCQKVVPSHIYQGSANVNNITVVAPFDNSTALAIAFSLPDGAQTVYAPMNYDIGNQPGASEGVYFWTYKIPLAVTEKQGAVGVSINAISATDNQTSYQCTFNVEPSIVPTVPSAPDNNTWDALLVLYQQNAAAIANFAHGAVPVGTITVNTLATGSAATVSVVWNAETSALDFTYGIPQGAKGDTGDTGPTGATGADGTDMQFAGEWNAATEYKNDNTKIDTVTLNGALWICVTTNTNSQPSTANTNWKLAAKGIKSVTATTGGLLVEFTDGTTSTITADLLTMSTIGIDATPTADSDNLVTSGGVAAYIGRKIWTGWWSFADSTTATIVGLEKFKKLLFSDGTRFFHGDFNVNHDDLHLWRIDGLDSISIDHLYLQYNQATGVITYDPIAFPSMNVAISKTGTISVTMDIIAGFSEIYAD